MHLFLRSFSSQNSTNLAKNQHISSPIQYYNFSFFSPFFHEAPFHYFRLTTKHVGLSRAKNLCIYCDAALLPSLPIICPTAFSCAAYLLQMSVVRPAAAMHLVQKDGESGRHWEEVGRGAAVGVAALLEWSAAWRRLLRLRPCYFSHATTVGGAEAASPRFHTTGLCSLMLWSVNARYLNWSGNRWRR